MSWTVHAVLIAWVPLVLLLFMSFPPRRAILTALIAGWLFLPIAGFDLTGFKSKNSVLSIGLLTAALLFDWARWRKIRLDLADAPFVVWCLWPAVSALANGLGAYEAGSAVLDKLLVWGVPYLIGRTYFHGVRATRELARAVFVGGLVYVPLCLWEIRMSPQLHMDLYGFHQHSWLQVHRGGGYRPTVFMHHGLMVGFWMAAASLAGLWLWRRAHVARWSGVSMRWLVASLVLTAVLCKSAGSLALLVLGAGLLLLDRRRLGRTAAIALLLVPPIYIAARATQRWSGDTLVGLVEKVASKDRVGSLQFRMRNETLIVARAAERPVTGWGRFGRWLPHDEFGGDVAVPDQLWVIAMGENGVVGLAALLTTLLWPCLRLARRLEPVDWNRPQTAPVIVLSVIVTLFAIDCLFNSMINPVYIVAAGSVAGFARRIAAATSATGGEARSPPGGELRWSEAEVGIAGRRSPTGHPRSRTTTSRRLVVLDDRSRSGNGRELE